MALLGAANAAAQDALRAGFLAPPARARPLVWWHWMGGNVTPAGIDKDLAWMRQAGLAGVQLFQGSLGTLSFVSPSAQFATPAWQVALREAVRQAKALGLEFDIASAPGWSETGGPWITPAQAMKKLVWSETTLTGGAPRRIVLPLPPTIAGPFQDEPFSAVEPGAPSPHFYRDARVIALPDSQDDSVLTPITAWSNVGPVDALKFVSGSYADRQELPFKQDAAPTEITLDYGRVIQARAFTLGLPSRRGFGAPALPRVTLQAGGQGQKFSTIAELTPGNSPQTTIAFPAVRARLFRVLLAQPERGQAGAGPPLAPGVDMPMFGPPAAAYTVSALALHEAGRLDRFEDKAGFGTALNYDDVPVQADSAGAVPSRAVIDLTRLMRADGTLDWTPPSGRWRILRLGTSPTGHRNGPAAPAATGLEADKLDAAAVTAHLTAYLAAYRAALGPDAFGARGIDGLLNDSIEAGPQNWTDDILAQFQRRRGYDPTPFLPALTGIIIDSAAVSNAFLYDFRATIADLLAARHYATLAREAHANGMTAYGEALEDRRPQLGDDEDMRRYQDVPMGAMWMFPPGGAPAPTYIADDLGAASVAHLWGDRLVGAESFTMFGHPWATSPRDLQPVADLEFALGINRIMIHESTSQPNDSKPGLALSPLLGQYFNRNETWAALAAPFVTYLARNAFMLQQGAYVADLAYFTGEEAPLTGLFGTHPPSDLPAGHAVDFVNATALRIRLHALPDGSLGTDGGPTYRALYLGGDSARMTVHSLRRIAALVRAGATLIGTAPKASRSLADDPAQFLALRAAIWGSNAGTGREPSQETQRHLGKGIVLSSHEPAAALLSIEVPPDFTAAGAGADKLVYLHRRTDSADIYFVSNRADAPAQVWVHLRSLRRFVTLWHAESGRIERATTRPAQGGTDVAIRLDALASTLIVLRDADDPDATPALADAAPVLTLTGPWQQSFAPASGAAPAPREATTGSWSAEPDPRLRYFSGTASYTRTFDVQAAWLKHHAILIDLGSVADLAQVAVNGQDAGILWRPPFRADVRSLLHAGRNKLTVRVTDLWVNRLIGDAQAGMEKATATTGPTYRADTELRPAGLIGPVTVLVQDTAP